MSEFSFPSNTTKKPQFSSLLLSDFFLFCSFILSHPLYFSYFIFFSPYLLKLLSFLSPLFITTSLLLLALFTLSPRLVHDNSPLELSESKVSFLLTTYHSLKERILRSKVDDESEDFQCFEELEAYKIVFDTSTLEIRENPDEVLELESKENCLTACADFGVGLSEALNGNSDDNPVDIAQMIVGGKRLQAFLQEKNELEKEEKEVKPLSVEFDKGEEQKEEKPLIRSESKVMGIKISEAEVSAYDGGEHTSKVMLNSQSLRASFGSTDYDAEYHSQTFGSNLGSFGSMRKEKEWKRTLACKLFEERHNVDGGEGMDLLWETYETDSSNKVRSKSNIKKGKKGGVEYCYGEEEEEEEEDNDGQLCCLQALKFSAGKMNLGMGRPNLVKISKALKGIGWFHHVSRHGKKGMA